MKGFDELRRNVDHIRKDVLDRAVKAAEDAAAEVIKKAVETAAPRDSGQLAGSIVTYESIDRKALTGSARRRLLVGPGKKKGFYGFFLSRGWRTGTRTKSAPHPDWLASAARSAEAAAYEAGVKAFIDVVEQRAPDLRSPLGSQ